MARSQDVRTREARKQRHQLRESRIRIDVTHELRTLKRSSRKQLERERAPGLWIFPRDSENLGGNGVHPPASLLRLPPELRQEIVYMSYNIDELEREVTLLRPENQERAKRLEWFDSMSRMVPGKMGKAMLAKFDLRSREGELVTLLSRRVGILCRVSPFLWRDMSYVTKRWQADLEKHIGRKQDFLIHTLKCQTITGGYGWLYAPDFGPLAPKTKKSQVVHVDQRQSQKKVRPRKCWYCTERHFGDDPVCPMARYDPKRWQQFTKKVGGWRGKESATSTFRGEKVVFEA
jgi:hypothetical protein